MASKKVEYICAYCGARVVTFESNGRPSPGFCSRKPKDRNGNMKPHSWRVSRKF